MEDDYGNSYGPEFGVTLYYDVEQKIKRDAAGIVREHAGFQSQVSCKLLGLDDFGISGRVVSPAHLWRGVSAVGQGEAPPKEHIDVTDVPVENPSSNIPLTERDGYWLTPIEVPFYDALRDTGLVFAVQPWIQGVESRFRADFVVFYDGGTVLVELDGHESHKTREQRIKDAKRDRWFTARKVQTLRWTGSEVHANAQECVRQLLEILRGTQARA